ncbi:hypothetical protein J6E39_01155 [bacterium]|nr:hypothetical protein [bacterium]
MTLGKIITPTIGKEIIAWPKTGAKGLIAAKPVKVNTGKLRYVPEQIGKVNTSGISTVNSDLVTKFAHITSHKDNGGTLVIGYMPDNYKKVVYREFVEALPERKVTRGLGKGRILPAVPAHWEESYKMLPHYHIDKIYTTGKGSGTNSVQSIVEKSLADIETQGRVTLDACCIDGKTSPAGFYYKLGFRFKDRNLNKQCEDWLKAGGSKDSSPFLSGIMFLPQENISHCLNYNKKFTALI